MARKKGEELKDSWVLLSNFAGEKISPKKWENLTGNRNKYLRVLGSRFYGLDFRTEDHQVFAGRNQFEALARKYENFERIIRKTFLILCEKVQRDDEFKVDETQIDLAIEKAQGVIEKENRIDGQTILTKRTCTEEQVWAIAGGKEANLGRIGKMYGLPSLRVEDGAVVVSNLQLASLEVAVKARFFILMASLEEVVSQGGQITEETIEQAEVRALAGLNAGFKDVAEITKRGHQVEKKTVALEALAESVLFEPEIVVETCPADPEFRPAEILTFQKAGGGIKGLMMKQSVGHMRRIAEKAGGVTIAEDKMRITIRGASHENIERARNYFIAFANLLAEKECREKTDVSRVLSVVLDEADPSTLQGIERQPKGKGQTVGDSSGRVKKFFRELDLRLYGARTPNQKKYISVLEADDYGLVLAQGPAGTGKTLLFLQRAVAKLRDHYRGEPNARFKKLVLSYPLISNGQKVGFLPGDLKAKTNGKYRTYYDHLVDMLAPLRADGEPNEEMGRNALEFLMDEGIIAIELLEDMMGKSYRNTIVVLDEAQNATSEQMICLLTRPEESSRLFIFGDVDQCYLPQSKEGDERFEVPSNILIDEEGVVCVKKNSISLPIGSHKDIGKFTFDKGSLKYVVPRSGFTEALICYSGHPDVACCLLERKDIQRRGLNRHILELRHALRDTSCQITGQTPKGEGSRDIETLLQECTLLPERPAQEARFGTLIDIRAAKKKDACALGS